MFPSEKLHLRAVGKWIGFFLRQVKAAFSREGMRRGMKPQRRLPAGRACLSSSFAAMEVSSQLKHVFRSIDTNADGKISSVELGEILRCLGQEAATAAREAERMIREVDCDGDGLIDMEEFMRVVDGGESRARGEEEEDLVAAFRLFDADGNGFISATELRRVLVGLGHDRCSLGDCSRMIRAVDRNGDGQVDIEEFMCMMSHDRTLI
ncbi:hypothetical protein Taro_024418 [Colocasia esculenta]|uniref:EF-hand domain-containing protein n=1 Tax=Colocasia esculenta TaxID=4460 RepID=A0A843VEF8_COLES|nr:hypothetical protein [Colocasia esculenta]